MTGRGRKIPAKVDLRAEFRSRSPAFGRAFGPPSILGFGRSSITTARRGLPDTGPGRTKDKTMRHRVGGRKLGRTSTHRQAMFRNMAAALIKHEQITTTLPKAKELRPGVGKPITLGKKGGMANPPRAHAQWRDDAMVAKLFGPLGERYRARAGGYCRVLRAGVR